MPVTVIYHADCLDGFGAAYAAWSQLGDSARYLPLHHGETWRIEDIEGHRVYILDFSLPPELLEKIARLATAVIQLDHHFSARKPWLSKLQTLPDGTQEHTHSTLPLQVIFNLDKSGARLAWEHFQPTRALPRLLRHIEDQDLWRFADPDTRVFCRALRLHPFSFEGWRYLIADTESASAPTYQRMLADGAAIDRFFQNEVTHLAQGQLPTSALLRGEPIDALQAVRHQQPCISDGAASWQAVKGLAINASALFSSELGHQLAVASGSFGLIWQLASDGEIKASLRSEGDFDVATIAARYGGGGHKNAAGFRMSAQAFLKEVLGLT